VLAPPVPDPQIVAAGKRHGLTVQDWSVATAPPGNVTVAIGGQLGPLGTSVGVGITETIGTRALGAQGLLPNQAVPAVLDTETSATAGDLLDYVVGIFDPLVLLGLDALSLAANYEAGKAGAKATGIIAPLLTLIPYEIPVSDSDFPSLAELGDDFPAILLSWIEFGATETGLAASGVYVPVNRTQADVTLTVDGVTSFMVAQNELTGSYPVGYIFTLRGLNPDPGAFTWQLTGPESTSGPIDASSLVQTGVISVYLRVPDPQVGQTYDYVLSVHATETCGTDPTKTLTADWSSPLTLTVRPVTLLPPGRDTGLEPMAP
jgi:hypothetical protein